jgi:hypothetical protein
MQRIMETLLERHGLALWVEDRLLRLLKAARPYTWLEDTRTMYIGKSATTCARWVIHSRRSTTAKVVSWQLMSWAISR